MQEPSRNYQEPFLAFLGSSNLMHVGSILDPILAILGSSNPLHAGSILDPFLSVLGSTYPLVALCSMQELDVFRCVYACLSPQCTTSRVSASATHCTMSATHCIMSATHCTMSATHCTVSAAHGMLSIVISTCKVLTVRRCNFRNSCGLTTVANCELQVLQLRSVNSPQLQQLQLRTVDRKCCSCELRAVRSCNIC
jgi:hypothetical protein